VYSDIRAAGFDPHRQTVCAIAYRFAREEGISNNFNNEIVTAEHDCLKSSFFPEESRVEWAPC
jgi:hypothetical protein